MSEFLLGLLAAFIAVSVFALGLHQGTGLSADNCRQYGAFTRSSVTYECKVRP